MGEEEYENNLDEEVYIMFAEKDSIEIGEDDEKAYMNASFLRRPIKIDKPEDMNFLEMIILEEESDNEKDEGEYFLKNFDIVLTGKETDTEKVENYLKNKYSEIGCPSNTEIIKGYGFKE